MPEEPTTERVRSYYEGFAHRYDKSGRFWERLLSMEPGRRWVASNAQGDVLEIGVGTGLNLPFYGPDVRLTGVDLSRAMLAEARRRAAELGREIHLREGDAQALEFPDDRFDTVVFTFVFGFAASSIGRWLRLPTGQRVAGGVVLAFGLFMVLYAFRARAPWLYREDRPLLSRVRPGPAGAFPLGMAFAIGWTPCIGPVLGAILTLAAAQGTTGRTLVLLFFYSLGLGLPIFLLGMGMSWAMGASRFISRNYRWIAGTGGVLMATIGVLLITGVWVRLLAPLLRLVNRFTPPI